MSQLEQASGRVLASARLLEGVCVILASAVMEAKDQPGEGVLEPSSPLPKASEVLEAAESVNLWLTSQVRHTSALYESPV